jgi:hypothetical protein
MLAQTALRRTEESPKVVETKSDVVAILAEAQQALEFDIEDDFTNSSDDDSSTASFGSDAESDDNFDFSLEDIAVSSPANKVELKEEDDPVASKKRWIQQRMTDGFEKDSLHLKHTSGLLRRRLVGVEMKDEAPAASKKRWERRRRTDGFEQDSLHLRRNSRVPRRKRTTEQQNEDAEEESELPFQARMVHQVPLAP